MRLLFVSGTSVGGAARSTYELAEIMRQRGHTVATLMTDDAATAVIERHKRWLNSCVKLDRHPLTRPFATVVNSLRRTIGCARSHAAGHAHPAWTCPLPENAFEATFRECTPDVVIVNSVERPAWRYIRQFCADLGIPTVLYVREASGVRHLVDPPAAASIIMANAEAHAVEVRALGFDCAVVPSVVETEKCITATDRTEIVMVNPVTMYGIDLALDIAQRLHHLPFTFVESWPLTEHERDALTKKCRTLGNARLLPYQDDPRQVYAHAKVLLMLCTVASRPRVVLEAQANGIPVLAVDRPGHGEVVGPGGILVAPDALLDEWVETLSNLWNDADLYEQLRLAALDHARRHDATPTAVAERFESLLATHVGTEASHVA